MAPVVKTGREGALAVQRSLEEKILTAFRQACAEGRLDVAEHLLQAPESLEGKPQPGSPLAKAYAEIAGRTRNRPRRSH